MSKTSFKSFILESTNDRGIFKALFLGGIPGAGKSYTVSKITDGAIQPRIVNTDKFIEYILHQKTIDLPSDVIKERLPGLIDTATHLTKAQLAHYLDGMLPLIADGTSNNIANILRRKGQLESVGYDTGMVWVNTSLETAIARSSERLRHVDKDFITAVWKLSEENREFYKAQFDMFIEVDNDHGELDDFVIKDVYRYTKKFFDSDIRNPVGKRNLQKLKDRGEKYLTDSLFTKENINNVVASWYFTQ